MRQSVIAVCLLTIGYLLGTLRAPAHADDSGKVVDALREIVRSQERQTDALRRIADNSAKCTR